MPAAELHVDKAAYLDQPYPGGESWRQAVQRCSSVLPDIQRYWGGQRSSSSVTLPPVGRSITWSTAFRWSNW